MALLDADRQVVRRRITEKLSESTSLSKTELKAAVDATDDWADANAASFNSAIPLPARTGMTTKQKALLLALVLLRRFEVA